MKQVEEMNARWQGYMEQREKYTHALEQRCSDLQQTVSQHHQQQQHQLSDEQQRRVDQILLEQRQKTELAQEARLKVTKAHAYLLTTREAAWYVILVVSVCLSDDNFRKP